MEQLQQNTQGDNETQSWFRTPTPRKTQQKIQIIFSRVRPHPVPPSSEVRFVLRVLAEAWISILGPMNQEVSCLSETLSVPRWSRRLCFCPRRVWYRCGVADPRAPQNHLCAEEVCDGLGRQQVPEALRALGRQVRSFAGAILLTEISTSSATELARCSACRCSASKTATSCLEMFALCANAASR